MRDNTPKERYCLSLLTRIPIFVELYFAYSMGYGGWHTLGDLAGLLELYSQTFVKDAEASTPEGFSIDGRQLRHKFLS